MRLSLSRPVLFREGSVLQKARDDKHPTNTKQSAVLDVACYFVQMIIGVHLGTILTSRRIIVAAHLAAPTYLE